MGRENGGLIYKIVSKIKKNLTVPIPLPNYTSFLIILAEIKRHYSGYLVSLT